MPRPRRTPKTAFGAWLDQWLRDHDDSFTVAGFAAAVGVTKSAVSLWLSGDTKRPPERRLRRIAEVTGEPLANLAQLTYTQDEWSPPATQPTVSPDLLDAMEERIRRAFREELAAALAQLRHDGSAQ